MERASFTGRGRPKPIPRSYSPGVRDSVPPVPEGAQVSEEEWGKFYDQFAHARVRRAVRVVSRLPSAPRCEACGSPYKGIGGVLMRMTGKAPSRKNPRWCK